MVNMDANSDKNAREIIEELTRMYNRKRQAGITQELNRLWAVQILSKGELDGR